MAKPKSGQERPPIRQSNGMILLAAAILLLLALLVAAGVVIANSAATKESPPELPVVSNQSLPTISSTATRPDSTAAHTNTPPPSPEKTAVPTLLPSLTPIPTSTPTDEPTVPPPSPSATNTDILALTATETKQAPLPTPVRGYSWTLKVPILMYHYISQPPEDADKYRIDLSVPPDAFRDQMAYLAENGFETVDLYDLSLAIAGKKELPVKPVIITMDDGYRDNYENAFPILQEFDFSATFFVVTQPIDDGNDTYLSWKMVEEMAGAGMRIEPHSKTHADLSGRERDYIIFEVLGSQETIAAHTGQTPRYFCYPGGRFDETTIEVVSDLDFWGAITTEGGNWHSFDQRFEIPRIRMRITTTLAEFAGLVDPGNTVSGKIVDS